MRLETFSYLPELTRDEVAAQVRAIVERGYTVGIEVTDRPDPYDHYWTLWNLPLFQVRDPDAVLAELEACRAENPDKFIRVNGYDPIRQGQAAAFVVHRPTEATA
jgi:ribulose-bisphosphate carboxylase small chain